MALSDTIKTLIRNAWDDGYPCLLATHGPEGPNITPKGSMIVFDNTWPGGNAPRERCWRICRTTGAYA